MKVVIMAGGKGTRISPLFPNIPKSMIKMNEVPVLERQINVLSKQGFKDITITISKQGDDIVNYFKDGHKFGVDIKYFVEDTPLGNAGALYKLDLNDDFLLINGDCVFDINLNRFVKYHNDHSSIATILTHPNSHPYDSSLIVAENGIVKKWINKGDERGGWYKNRVNSGIHILSPKVLENNHSKETVDLDKDILTPLSNKGLLYCYDSSEYIKDMGTPERFYDIEKDIKNGIVKQKNLINKQKAIFLDRDGTINKFSDFLTDINKFELLPRVSEAIKLINKSGYLTIIITNQPVIARGELDYKGLDEIHNKMETLLGKDGAYIDGIYFCPHHPDKGFPGEIKELKIDCDCRKPKPGLLLKASKDFNIDLNNSWMIGDSENDILAGKNAGTKTILLDKIDLLDAVNMILENTK